MERNTDKHFLLVLAFDYFGIIIKEENKELHLKLFQSCFNVKHSDYIG